MKNQEISVKMLGVRFRFDNSGEQTVIAEAVDKEGNRFCVKGPMEDEDILPDLQYRFYGRWSNYKNKRTGRTEKQFWFNSFVQQEPLGREAIINYLCLAGAGNGMGKVRATQLYDLQGEACIEVAREDPEYVSTMIPKINERQAEAISTWLKDRELTERCTVEMMHLLNGRGFPKDTARKAIKRWGAAAARIVGSNPYRLMEFRGCGFLLCDRMWIQLGLPKDRLKRQTLAIWYALASDSNGHCWYEEKFARAGLRNYVLGGDFDRAAELGVRSGLLERVRGDGEVINGDGTWYYAEKKVADQERSVAKRMAIAVQEPSTWPSVDDLDDISDHQREELRKALHGSLGILGGSPGTGKTWTAARLIKKLPGLVAIAAPTGKAAVRITESMESYGIRARAKTWHSLLEVDSAEGGWSFLRGKHNPWPYQFIIGDESSMIDISIMRHIMEARARGTRILLVGDVNQLPPVGRGAPLRDMIDCKVPYGELREIKRNSGGIVEACAAIRDGEPWSPGDNLLVDNINDPEQQIEMMLQRVREIEGDPVWNGQVLVAVNEKSKLSRKTLNAILQAELNPGNAIPGWPFRPKDKIVNLANKFFPAAEVTQYVPTSDGEEVTKNDRGDIYVANGELGRVEAIQGKVAVVSLENPKRFIKILKGDKDFSGSWDLGYALSVHKSQGSEWPTIITLVDSYPGAKMVCSREWIYTAISRAKERCVLVGPKHVADGFCRRRAISWRLTFLRQLYGTIRAREALATL